MFNQELLKVVKEKYKVDKTFDYGCDGDFQKLCKNFVNENVLTCCNMLISELAQEEKYFDDLYPILQQDDYQESVQYYLDNLSREEVIELLIDKDIEHNTEDTNDQLIEVLMCNLKENDVLEDFASDNNIEPQTHEALEHWIVTPYLARLLQEQGEMVTDDFLGLTIWGRCTSGQAIYIDGVISRIVKNVYLK